MAGSVNKVIILGNLGRDPEVRTSNDGNKIVQLNIATSERWKDRNSGEQKEKTEWHRVVIFNEGLVKVVQQYVKKGAQVYIEGQLTTRKWKDEKTGQDKYSSEVLIQGFNSSLTMLGGGSQNQVSSQDAKENFNQDSPPSQNDLDVDIPF